MRSKIIAAVPITVAALALAGCSHFGHSSATSGASAHASVLATNTSAQYAKTQAEQVLTKCMPAQNALTQLEWVKNITSPRQGVTARHAFETCAGVNPANDAKFKTQVENQGAGCAESLRERRVKRQQGRGEGRDQELRGEPGRAGRGG